MNKSVLNFADLFCFIAEMAHISASQIKYRYAQKLVRIRQTLQALIR